MATGDKVSVILPQLFVSFLATPPRLNPAYDKVSRESESAILEFCKLDERVTKIIRKGDFSRFVAIAAPDAEEAKFRTYCDWCNWVFPYDDLFDNGYLRSDAPAAQAKMKALFYGMEPHGSARTTGQCNLVRFHNIIWERIRSSASVGVQQRFARTMRQFCDAVLKQVITLAADETPTVEEMLAIRRQSAGVGPLFPLYEYANNLDLPDDFFDHAAIQELQELGMDCALLQNDMLSYPKEEAEGVPHNVVAICRIRGLQAQQAFDHIGAMLDQRLVLFKACMARRPRYQDQRIDREAESYIQGIRNTISANLYWSFASQRYFGGDAEIVRHTRQVLVLRDPPFMSP